MFSPLSYWRLYYHGKSNHEDQKLKIPWWTIRNKNNANWMGQTFNNYGVHSPAHRNGSADMNMNMNMIWIWYEAILNSLQQQPKMTEERKGIGWSFYFCNAPSAGSVLLLKRNSIISWDSSCNSVSGFWNLCPSFTSSERRVECLLIVAALGCCIITARSKAFPPMEFVPLHPSQCFHLCESHIIH